MTMMMLVVMVMMMGITGAIAIIHNEKGHFARTHLYLKEGYCMVLPSFAHFQNRAISSTRCMPGS